MLFGVYKMLLCTNVYKMLLQDTGLSTRKQNMGSVIQGGAPGKHPP
jgi:hypothetical protein